MLHELVLAAQSQPEAAGFILRGIKGIFVGIGSIIAAILSGVIAATKGRNPFGWAILGLFFSIIAGGGMPVQGVLFAKCISSLSLPSTRYSQLRSDIDFWSLMYFVVAVVIFLVSCGYGIVFAYCSELL